MHTIINNDNQIIEFKHMSGHDMIGEVKQLFLEYAQSLEIDLSFQDFETEVNSLPGKYTAPGGALILALAGDKAVGSIALRKFSEDICELKRLFVRDNFKGLGIGRDLITKVIEEAAKQGYKYIRLDTLPTMKKAQEIYISFGFYDIEPYIYNPISGSRFMEFNLKDKM